MTAKILMTFKQLKDICSERDSGIGCWHIENDADVPFPCGRVHCPIWKRHKKVTTESFSSFLKNTQKSNDRALQLFDAEANKANGLE